MPQQELALWAAHHPGLNLTAYGRGRRQDIAKAAAHNNLMEVAVSWGLDLSNDRSVSYKEVTK